MSADNFEELPAALWVERCRSCGVHAHPEPTTKGEKYRHDEEAESGEHVYVFTDERLAGGGHIDAREQEPVAA